MIARWNLDHRCSGLNFIFERLQSSLDSDIIAVGKINDGNIQTQ